MNKYKKLSAMSMAMLTLTLMVPVFVSARISNDDDNVFVGENTVISTSTNLVNGSDDIGGGLVTPGATSTNTGDNLISNGGDDEVFADAVLSVATSTNSTSTLITNGDDDLASTTKITNGDDDIISTTTPVATTTPIIPTSTVTSGGSSSSGSSGYRSALNLNIITPDACNYLTSYLKFGQNNDAGQVSKLQSFLKNTEKINVDVNGTFDTKTLNAVKLFQKKYVNEIMSPWGLKDSSGYVYYTTQKKVNEIYCKTTFNLTMSQLADIANYKKRNIATNIVVKPVIQSMNIDTISTSTVEESSGSTTPAMDEEVGLINNNVNDTQAAAVVNTGFFGKIWNLIKSIF